MANLTPIDKMSNIIERMYFVFINKYNAHITKNIIVISLWEETKLSITTSGFKAKKTMPKISLSGVNFFKIFPIKKTAPKKLIDISILKRKNVGRKNFNPIDKGTVKPSQVGPYGKSL